MNKQANFKDRTNANIVITSIASSIVAGILSYFILGESGSINLLGMNVPSYAMTGLLVGTGAATGQWLARKSSGKLQQWWPSWSQETISQLETIMPVFDTALFSIVSGSIALREVPSLYGASIMGIIGSSAYLVSEFTLDKLLYSETGIDYV